MMMKILTVFYFTLIVAALTSGRAEDAASGKTLLKRFQGALYEEEVNQDLEKAAAGYESVIAEFDKNRTVVATAVFRLAEVHREKGEKPQAIGLYRRLIREFPDEKPLVKLCEGYLRGLGAEVPKAGDSAVGSGAEMTGVTATIRTEEAKALAHAKATATESPDLLNHVGEDGNSLLSNAASESFLTVVGFLLDQGVPINGAVKHDSTALHLAAENGHLSMVKLLIERGAEVDRPNSLGRSPLHLAIARGHRSTVEFLIESGADAGRMVKLFERPEKRMWTVSVEVNKRGNSSIQHQSVKGNALHLDILNSRGMVDFLLKEGVPQIAGSELSHTPLEISLRTRRWEIAHVLIAAGADLNTKTADGMTPLMFVAGSNSDEALALVELFLKRGVDPNVARPNGETALLYASISKQGNRVAEKLLSAQANPNSVTKFGESPLVEAISRSNFDTARLLLEAGANPNVKSKKEVPALSELMELLLENDLDSKKEKEVLSLAQQMVDTGADINAVNQSNETGIFLAKGKSAGAIVDFYLKNDVDLWIESKLNGMAYWSLSRRIVAEANRVPRDVQLRVWRMTKFPKLADREKGIWFAVPGDFPTKDEILLAVTVDQIAPENSIRLVDVISGRFDLRVVKPADIAVWRGMEKVVPEEWDMPLQRGDILSMERELEAGEKLFRPTKPTIQVAIGEGELKPYETKEVRGNLLIDPAENWLFSIQKMGLEGNPELNLKEAVLVRDGKSYTVNLREKEVLWREGDELTVPSQQDPEKVLTARREGIFVSRPEIGFITKVQQKRTGLPELKNRYQLAGTILDFYIRGEQVLPHPDLDRVVVRRLGEDGKEKRIPFKLSEISKEPPSNAVVIQKYPDKNMSAEATAKALQDALKAVAIIDPESVRTLDERQNNRVLVFGRSRDPWPKESISKQLDPLMESAKLNQISYKAVHVPFPPSFRLQWGDIIEIPVAKDSANEPWVGFDSTMWFKLKRWAQVDVEVEYLATGKWGSYSLAPPQPLFQKGERIWDRGFSETKVGVEWRGVDALFQAVGNEDLDWKHFLVKRKHPDSTVMIDNPTMHLVHFISGDQVVLTPRVK